MENCFKEQKQEEYYDPDDHDCVTESAFSSGFKGNGLISRPNNILSDVDRLENLEGGNELEIILGK